MPILLTLFVGSGLLMASLSVPLILRRIGPNPWYGFRVRQTLDDPAVWYPANAYAGRGLLALAATIVGAAIGLYGVPGIDLAVYASAIGAITLGGLLLILILIFRHLHKLTREP